MNSVPLYIVAILIWERLIAWCEKSRGNSTSCFPAHYHHLSILKISRLLNACTCMVCICAFTIPIPTRLSDGYYFKVTVVHVCLTHMSDMVLTSFCSHLFPGDCAFKVYTHVAMSAFGLRPIRHGALSGYSSGFQGSFRVCLQMFHLPVHNVTLLTIMGKYQGMLSSKVNVNLWLRTPEHHG